MKVITYEEWIEQTERLTKQQVALLKAQDAIGKSAYEIALKELGKTEEELPVEDWLASLKGADGVSAYELAVEGGLNDVEVGEEYEGEEPIDEATFGALLAELIREKFTS